MSTAEPRTVLPAAPPVDPAGAARTRRLARSTVAAVAARGIGVGLSVATIPIAIAFLGTERYGVWVALTSLASVLIFGDLGVGNALVNLVSAANGRGDREATRRAFSAGIAILVVIAGVFAAGSLIAAAALPWADLIGARSSRASAEAAPAAVAFLLLFAAAIPLVAIERVRLGLQEAHINSFWSIVGSVASFCGLLVSVALGADLPSVVLATAGPPLVALLLNGTSLLLRRPWLRPSLLGVGRAEVHDLSRVGFMFFILQLAVAVAYQSDVVVAANVIGPEAAATYSVTLRLFMFAPTLVGLALMTIWPAYTEAIVRGDGAWVRRTLRRSVLASLAFVGGASAILLGIQEAVVRMLTRGTLHAPLGLVIGVAVWAVLSATFSCVAILMNAASVIRFQVIVAVSMAAVSVGASYALAKTIGIEGVIWGTVVSYVLIAAIPVSLYVPRLLSRIDAGPTR